MNIGIGVEIEQQHVFSNRGLTVPGIENMLTLLQEQLDGCLVEFINPEEFAKPKMCSD